jgi:hypothetical protein
VALPRRHVQKELLCPACGDVLAAAVYTRWPGNLVLTSPGGYRIQPESVAVQIRLAQQDQAANGPATRLAARDRLDFLRRHGSELVYDLRCGRGHSTLRTAPQIVRAMRNTAGAWATLGS